MRKELRAYSKCALRAEEGSRKITGYPIVFGERSVLLPDWEHGTAVEVIEKGAVTEELLRQCDIVACINHDENQMIGRSVNGSGSLTLSVDGHGVKMEMEAPATVYGDIVYEGAKRGDFQGMSFGFWLDPDNDVEYEEAKEGGETVYIRHIKNIRGIFDVSVVTHPAYPSTEFSAERSALSKEFADAFSKERRSADMLRDYDEITQFINR